VKVWCRWGAALAGAWAIFASVVLSAQPPPGFEPAGGEPLVEQLPAAPLVIAAYAFVWVALFVYAWSIWRRLVRVEGELTALEQRIKR
jgi:CcmD family protein